MVHIDASSFLKEIIHICNKSGIVITYESDIEDDLIVKVRVYLIKDDFIDVFYNAGNRKTSFALIKNKKRIYGADNALPIGWHIHPFEDPQTHIPSGTVTFEEFIKTIEESQKSRLML
ncbi:hypothetical protein KKH56_04025 [bacterium]|nr:hypothetical protein [bacterium]